jgi:hypothetical protein
MQDCCSIVVRLLLFMLFLCRVHDLRLQLLCTTKATTICSTSTIPLHQCGETSFGVTLSPRIWCTGSTWRTPWSVINGTIGWESGQAPLPSALMASLSFCTQVYGTKDPRACLLLPVALVSSLEEEQNSDSRRFGF